MKLTLNLASRSYLNSRALYALYSVVGAALAGLLLMNMVSCFKSQAHVQQIRFQMAELDQHLVNGQDLTSTFNPVAYEALLKDIDFANEIILQDSFRWTELLGRLETVVPNGVAIRGLQPDFKARSLNITGLSYQLADLRTFLDNLLQDAAFRETYLLQQSRTTAKGAGGRPFDTISFSLVTREAF